MKKKIRTLALLLSVVLLTSLFAGCGSGTPAPSSAPPSSSPTSGTTPGITTPSGTPPPPPPSSEPITVKAMIFQTCVTLDRYGNNSGMAGPVQVLWGDSLIWQDEKQQYHPWLATWETSDDYLEWTFHLRDDAYFSDGTKLTAEDVAFTYDRNINAPTAVNDPISGVIQRTEVIDEHTIKFHFKAISPAAYECLYGYSIISKAAFEKNPDHYYDLPMGTGPYEITAYDPVDFKMSFAKKADWWGWKVLGMESNVDFIEMEYVSEQATRINALRAGDVQIIDNVSPGNFQTLLSNNLAYGVWDTLGMGLLMLNMNPGSAMSDDANLRQALSLCIDRAGIVQSLRGGAGSVMDYPVQAGWVGYKAGTNVYRYDPKLAADLVKSSKYDGRVLNMIYRNSGESEIAQAIQAFADAVGIKIDITLVEPATYSDMLRAGNYDIGLREWSGSCGENTKFFYEFLGQDLFNNGYGKVNPDFSAMALTLQFLNDPKKIADTRSQLFASMAENYAPHIYMYTQFSSYAFSPNISGLQYFSAFNNIDYRMIIVN